MYILEIKLSFKLEFIFCSASENMFFGLIISDIHKIDQSQRKAVTYQEGQESSNGFKFFDGCIVGKLER